jgi:hypothetical protein
MCVVYRAFGGSGCCFKQGIVRGRDSLQRTAANLALLLQHAGNFLEGLQLARRAESVRFQSLDVTFAFQLLNLNGFLLFGPRIEGPVTTYQYGHRYENDGAGLPFSLPIICFNNPGTTVAGFLHRGRETGLATGGQAMVMVSSASFLSEPFRLPQISVFSPYSLIFFATLTH